MNTLDPRAEARNRANRRLHRMTIGTAALGVASVGILGATAAFSYDGTQATSDAVALAVTGDAGTTSSTDTASATATPTRKSSGSSSSTTTTPAVTSTSGTAHASTGGS